MDTEFSSEEQSAIVERLRTCTPAEWQQPSDRLLGGDTYKYVKNIVAGRVPASAAPDVTHDALMRAINACAKLLPTTTRVGYRGWLAQIARRECVNWYRAFCHAQTGALRQEPTDLDDILSVGGVIGIEDAIMVRRALEIV